MAKIIFYLPGNGTHSFLIEDRFERMYNEQLGINALGKTGFPIAISHQGIDYDMFPFLKDVHAQYDNFEVVGALYGHGLLPLIRFSTRKETSAQIRWENEHGAEGNVPVTFFSEFYSPASPAIPTEYFFILKEQTCSYSLDVTGINLEEKHLSMLADDVTSVNYNGKIGILIDGFKSFIKAWFAFASIPSQDNLQALMKEFDKMADDPRDYIVVPMDLEQPWVGSMVGEELWTIFFNEVAKRPGAKNVAPLSSILGLCKEKAVKIQQPHRVLTKWTVHDVQFKTIMDLNSLKLNSNRERRIFSLAFASDHLSSLNRTVFSTIRDISHIQASDLSGKKFSLSQGPNSILQECCNVAYTTLRHRDRSLQEGLEALPERNFFANNLIDWAKKNNL